MIFFSPFKSNFTVAIGLWAEPSIFITSQNPAKEYVQPFLESIAERYKLVCFAKAPRIFSPSAKDYQIPNPCAFCRMQMNRRKNFRAGCVGHHPQSFCQDNFQEAH